MFPTTYFEFEKTPKSLATKRFFLKPFYADNSKGIEILSGDSLPALVPQKHLLQEEIIPRLYYGKKFDIRVLCCVARNGHIMIYKNLFYRINPNLYKRNKTTKNDANYQYTAPIATGSLTSFFQKIKPNEFECLNYLKQLENLVPQIYKFLIPFANRGFVEDLNSSFMIWGLDFIPSNQNNNLIFLELNSTPGWYINYGIKNYQEFYSLATHFILNTDRNSEECIYTSVS